MRLPGPAPDRRQKYLTVQDFRYLRQGKPVPIMVSKCTGFQVSEMLPVRKNRCYLQYVILLLPCYADKINRAVLVKAVNPQIDPAGWEFFLPYLIAVMGIFHFQVRLTKTRFFYPKWKSLLRAVPH